MGMTMGKKQKVFLHVALCLFGLSSCLGEWWIQKANAALTDISWKKCFGGTGNEAVYYGSNIVGLADGAAVFAISGNSVNGDFPTKNGGEDIHVVKLSPQAGDIVWERAFGGPAQDEGAALINTSDGGFAFVGTTYGDGGDVVGHHGAGDIWVVKLDGAGALQWQKCLGGGVWDRGIDIAQTKDGGIVVAGYTQGNGGDVSGYHGGWSDGWIAKLDVSGDLLWQRCCGGPGRDQLCSFRERADGTLFCVGFVDAAGGDVSHVAGGYGYDGWIIVLSDDGTFVREKSFGSSGNYEVFHNVHFAKDGRVYFVGIEDVQYGPYAGARDGWLVCTNASLNLLWEKTIGGTDGEDCFYDILPRGDGFIVLGTTSSNNGDVSGNHGVYDGWLIEINASGDVLWNRCFGGSANDWVYGFTQLSNDHFVFAGNTQSNNGDVTGHKGGLDVWLIKYGLDPVPTPVPTTTPTPSPVVTSVPKPTRTPSPTPVVTGVPVAPRIPGDFDGDGKADVLLNNRQSGHLLLWHMKDVRRTSGSWVNIGRVYESWVVGGVADFDKDGRADILLHEQDAGKLRFWFMDDSRRMGTAMLEKGSFLEKNYIVPGVGDFDGDGNADILLQDQITGEAQIWFLDKNVFKHSSDIQEETVSRDYVIAGVGDVDLDGKADILLNNRKSGQLLLWLMNGARRKAVAEVVPSGVSGEWVVAMVGDLSGDGYTDIVCNHRGTGEMALWRMSKSRVTNNAMMVSQGIAGEWAVAGASILLSGDAVSDDRRLWK